MCVRLLFRISFLTAYILVQDLPSWRKLRRTVDTLHWYAFVK
jgi:hypothetical protein